MLWPDALIALSTGALGFFALVMLLDRATYVSRISSGAYAAACIGIAVGLYASGLLMGAAINAVDASIWAAIFVARGTQRE